jgi:hypothetical protein
MADTKISAMTNALTLTGSEFVPLVQSGANVKDTLSTVAAFCRGNAGAFSSTVTQTGSITAGTAFTFNSTDYAGGVTLASGSRITVPVAGTYNLQWSGQFDNPESNVEQVAVWIKVNGSDVPGSTGIITLPGRKNPATTGKLIVGWNFFLTMTASQYVEIYWLPAIATVTVPTYPASTAPAPVYPSTASVIATMQQVA